MFQQRVSPYAGPRVRGYRSQEVRWADKVNDQDVLEGEDGFLQGGGLAVYRDDDENLKVARTAKVQVVPEDAQDTHEMPVHMKVLSDRSRYDRARRTLRGWAIKIVKFLAGKHGAKQATVKEIGREKEEEIIIELKIVIETKRKTLTMKMIWKEPRPFY